MPAVAETATVPATLAATLERALDSSLSENTRSAYRTAWRAWAAFAESHGCAALPAAPEMVAAYLAARFDAGAKMSTLRMALAAVAKAHDASGRPSPASHPTLRMALRGFARQLAGTGQRQARALDFEAVATVRGHLNGTVRSSPHAAATMALVSVVSEAGLRRSEAAALRWEDVAIEGDSTGRITVHQSKTDQTGEGAIVAITPRAVDDLLLWKSMQPEGGDGRVWAVGPAQINRRIAKVCRDAGLGEGYTGHSGRVGMAARMVRNNAPTTTALRQGRWADVRMLRRYTRNESAAEALPYL